MCLELSANNKEKRYRLPNDQSQRGRVRDREPKAAVKGWDGNPKRPGELLEELIRETSGLRHLVEGGVTKHVGRNKIRSRLVLSSAEKSSVCVRSPTKNPDVLALLAQGDGSAQGREHIPSAGQGGFPRCRIVRARHINESGRKFGPDAYLQKA